MTSLDGISPADLIGFVVAVAGTIGGSVAFVVSRFDRAFDRLRTENAEQHESNNEQLRAARKESAAWREEHGTLHRDIARELGEISGRQKAAIEATRRLSNPER